jgi:predicted nucleic acid-binding protein
MYLLDVNALLAIKYPEHVHHPRVRAWIAAVRAEQGNGGVVFATCPITELGFVRIASGKSGHSANVDSARADLHTLKSRQKMRFIPDDIPARRLPAWVHRWAQTTDGYLLALAKAHGGQLATLDRFIPGALLIPDEASMPLMVREEGVLSDWAAPLLTSEMVRRELEDFP